jgi:hypothetical protein
MLQPEVDLVVREDRRECPVAPVASTSGAGALTISAPRVPVRIGSSDPPGWPR